MELVAVRPLPIHLLTGVHLTLKVPMKSLLTQQIWNLVRHAEG
jgi:hypothetical protein